MNGFLQIALFAGLVCLPGLIMGLLVRLKPVYQLAQRSPAIRSAVVLGEVQSITQGGQPAINKQKVFIQDYTAPAGEGPEPPSEVLSISVLSSKLLIKSWREVYRIIR